MSRKTRTLEKTFHEHGGTMVDVSFDEFIPKERKLSSEKKPNLNEMLNRLNIQKKKDRINSFLIISTVFVVVAAFFVATRF